MTPEGDDLAAKVFGAEWAKWATRTGPTASKARQQMRKTAPLHIRMEALKAEDHACRDCSAFVKKGPHGSYCERDSDFHGYATVKPSHICYYWSEQK